MSERITVSYDKKPCYDILFAKNFDELPEELAEKFQTPSRKLCIVTDSQVASLYADKVKELLEPVSRKTVVFTFSAGEESKTLDTVRELYTFLIQEKFDRSDMLIALGGGVVGDLTGYAAATYLRGIDFIQIPTTLLAQVDSSIGGKTGVDFDGYKNMVGAFHMPKLVYMNLKTLETLEPRQYYNGFAEAMKSALIGDARYYEWLISNMYEIIDRDPDTMLEMVKRSCEIKRRIVEKDPSEKGERALLNLGHTLGHAIEKATGFSYLHGECVALGCVAAAYISWKKEMIPMEEYYEIRDMFVPFKLPISTDNLDPAAIIELTKSDKKMKDGQITFVLLKKIGQAVLDTSVTEDEMAEAIKELNFTAED